MKKSQKGFSAIHILVLIVVLGVIGLAGWLVWQKQSDDDMPAAIDDLGNNIVEDGSTGGDGRANSNLEPLKLYKASLPDGWTDDGVSDSNIVLSNASNGCSVEVIYTSDTAESNAPDVDQFQQTINSFKKADIDVQAVRDTMTVSVAGTDGSKKIDSQTLTLTYPQGQQEFEKHGYEPKTESLTHVKIRCPQKADLANAEQAMRAVVFPK